MDSKQYKEVIRPFCQINVFATLFMLQRNVLHWQANMV